MADKVKDVAKSEALRIGALTGEAAKSGAYLYPIKVSQFLPLPTSDFS